jgi:hypothetical protein
MEIRRVQGIDDCWDDYVWNSPGGTIFHTTRFLSYHPAGRFEMMNLQMDEGSEIRCVLPGARVSTGDGPVFRSPVGASFGGPVFGDQTDLEVIGGALDCLSLHLRGQGLAGAEIELPPACYWEGRSEALAFMLTTAGYQLKSREATSVIPLRLVESAGLRPKVMRDMRRADSAGVRVGPGTDIGAFYEVLVKNLSAKGAVPTHSPGEIERLFVLFPDRMKIFEARLEGELVGGCFTMLCNRRTALAFYVCVDPERKHLRIAERTLYQCIEWLIGLGYDYLDLGTVSIGGKVNWGLLEFKNKFLSRLYVRDRYCLRFREARP